MSKPRPDLDNSVEAIRDLVVNSLAPQRQINTVRLTGSRSPLCKDQPRPDSDWDLQVTVDSSLIKIFHVADYRTTNDKCHVDVSIRTAETVDEKSVEIWPTDDYGVLR